MGRIGEALNFFPLKDEIRIEDSYKNIMKMIYIIC